MIVYHGSDSNFKKLRIGKELVKHQSTYVNEGLGIYFFTDAKSAETYGRYVYTLMLNEEYFLDFRKKTVCAKYISDICRAVYKETRVNISGYIDTKQLAQHLYTGNVAIDRVCHEIYLLLDSNEKWYKGNTQTVREKTYRIVRNYNKNHLFSYMFNYQIPDVGIIKKVDDNIVRIVDKVKRY